VKKAYICCTVRTADMFDRFQSRLEENHLHFLLHPLEQKNVWYYDKYADIALLEITAVYGVC